MNKPIESAKQTTLSLFWQFTKPRKLYFWLGTIGAGVGVFIQDIIPPIIIAGAFNKLQTNNSSLVFANFYPYVLAYFACMVFGTIIWRIQVWFVWQYEVPGVRDIAVHIFDHLQKMGATFHANRFGGSLVSQTNKFLGAYERTMDEFTWSITTGIVAFTMSILVLAFIAPLYALLFALVSVAYFTYTFKRTQRNLKYDRELATSESQRTAKLADMITNASAVTTYAGEVYEKNLFEKQADHTVNSYFRLLKQAVITDTISQTMTNSIALLSFVSGIMAITVFHKPAGVLYIAVSYTLQLTRRLWESRRVMRNLNRSFGDATDMTEILGLVPDVLDAPDALPIKAGRGDIKLHNVDFLYPEQTEKLLFKKLDLHIKPGEKVGLVGKSGSGKTTLTKILLRLIDIAGGEIMIDGQNIAEVTQRSLRQSIAYVPQEPLMFHRTIAENIKYGNPDASDEEVIAVSRMANALEFIQALPEGFETLVGERGVKLSGGQRQRVAIARAMLKNAPILLLDEATSALDSESEVLIQEALWKLMEGRTAIVIAHRLSTIQKMDRILVMEDGEIIEQGTHKELTRQKGIYSELWSHQSGGFIED